MLQAGALAAPFVRRSGVRAAPLRKVTLTLPWLAEGSNAYAFVAKQNGYWAEAGLDVQISRGYGSVAAAQAVGAGQFDFGLAAAPSGIQQAAKGIGVVAICNCGYDATMSVAVLDDSPVRVPKDLAGKQMASTVTSGEYPFLPAFAKNAGLDLAAVTIVQCDPNVRSRLLMERKVDAVSGFAVSIAPLLVVNKLKIRFMLYSSYGLKLYNNALLTRPMTIQQDPQLCAAMAQGIARAIKFCLLQPDQALNAFLKQVPEVALTAGGPLQVRTGMGIFATTMFGAPAKAHGIGVSDANDYATMADLVTRYLGAPGDPVPKADTLFTNDFVGKETMTETEWAQADDKLKEFRYFFG
jgi:ABC-type nitrate/sulfonate/bicarbonate transport system substrate-binding protein